MALITNPNASYAEQERGFAGQLADLKLKDADTYVQGEATLEIPFGAAVAEGDQPSATDVGTPCKAVLPLTTVRIAGILLHAHVYDPAVSLGTTGVKPKELINVLKKGRVYVTTEGSVTKGNAAFVRVASGAGGTQLGALRADGDTSTAEECTGIIFAESRTGAGLVPVDVDIPAYNGDKNV